MRIYSYQKNNTNEYPNIFVSKKQYEWICEYIRIKKMIQIWYKRIFVLENIRIYLNIWIFVTPWNIYSLSNRRPHSPETPPELTFAPGHLFGPHLPKMSTGMCFWSSLTYSSRLEFVSQFDTTQATSFFLGSSLTLFRMDSTLAGSDGRKLRKVIVRLKKSEIWSSQDDRGPETQEGNRCNVDPKTFGKGPVASVKHGSNNL